MIRHFSQRLTAAAALLIAAGLACGAQPPDVVASDPEGNTAMGTAALGGLQSGTGNTASGYSALQFNSTGIYNTASGF